MTKTYKEPVTQKRDRRIKMLSSDINKDSINQDSTFQDLNCKYKHLTCKDILEERINNTLFDGDNSNIINSNIINSNNNEIKGFINDMIDELVDEFEITNNICVTDPVSDELYELFTKSSENNYSKDKGFDVDDNDVNVAVDDVDVYVDVDVDIDNVDNDNDKHVTKYYITEDDLSNNYIDDVIIKILKNNFVKVNDIIEYESSTQEKLQHYVVIADDKLLSEVKNATYDEEVYSYKLNNEYIDARNYVKIINHKFKIENYDDDDDDIVIPAIGGYEVIAD